MQNQNVMQRKESVEQQKGRTQVQMRGWRRRNQSQQSEFESLYGSVSGSLSDENQIKYSHHTNSSNNNNSSQNRSINRNSSKDSFYSCTSANHVFLQSSLTDPQQEIQQLQQQQSDDTDNDYDDDNEEFKSIRESNSLLSQNQPIYNNNNQVQGGYQNYYFKQTIDDERDSGSSLSNQLFLVRNNRNSMDNKQNRSNEEGINNMNRSNVNDQMQQDRKTIDCTIKISNIPNIQNIQKTLKNQNKQNRHSNGHVSINQRKSESSDGRSSLSSQSSVINYNHPLIENNLPKYDDKLTIGLRQPFIQEDIKKTRNSVTFNHNNNYNNNYNYNQNYDYINENNNQINQISEHNNLANLKNQVGLQKSYQQSKVEQNGKTYLPPQYTNNSNNEQESTHSKQQSLRVNRGKSLSALKRMVNSAQTNDEGTQQQPNQMSSSNQLSMQSLNNSQNQNASSSSCILNQSPLLQQQGTFSSGQSQNYKSLNSSLQYSPHSQFNFQQSQQLQTNKKKVSTSVLESPTQPNRDELSLSQRISSFKRQKKSQQQQYQDEYEIKEYQENNNNNNNNNNKGEDWQDRRENQNELRVQSGFEEKYMREFLYYSREKKKEVSRIAHKNRLIERKKRDIKANQWSDVSQKYTLNLTLLISIILEKHANLKYFLFLNHVIGAISRGFVYFFLIFISLRHTQYFIVFAPCILITRLYYLVSMYYLLFYFEQKSISFRKISKIFNNFFHLPSEYKKPIMSEMIDVMNKNLRDQEEKSMKRKFIFCPAEINYLCLSHADSRKRWNLFYLSNFIYQGIESICLYPLVIAFTIKFYSSDQITLGLDFLIFARYIIVGALSIFFFFCFFLILYGNKKFKIQ